MKKWGWLALPALLVAGGVAFGVQQARAREAAQAAALVKAQLDAFELKRRELDAQLALVKDEPEVQPSTAAVELGPVNGGAVELRRDAVLDLLAGRQLAARLPVLATDPGAAFDKSLRDALAPVRVVYRPGQSRPGCTCPPGDPLCSCY